jgi:RNA polymerase sigma factor (sigma-70 family)
LDDSQIIEQFWQRNELAIRQTEDKYGSYCFSIAYHILGNREDAEECVNDTLNRVWNSIPPQRPDQLRPYLAKIIRNRSFDLVKARMTGKRGCGEISAVLDELDECISSSSNAETEYEGKELAECINRFLTALKRRDCVIFLRRYFYVDSIQDIARHSRIKSSNVIVILSRIRKRLGSYLEKEGFNR